MDKDQWALLPELACRKLVTLNRSKDFAADACVREMRRFNKTKRIYAVNPYVEVYQPRENLFCLYTENCDAGGAVYMHLIVGPEKAMLIDTAYGLGDVKALVDGLTGGKPLIVVNTHGHCDHAYGNCRFPRVYCHEHEVAYLEAQNEHIWDYLFDESGACRWLRFDRADLPTFTPYEIVPFKDGRLFDLGGGYVVEAVWLGGHTPGHCGFLDRQSRIFFCGDDITAGGSGAGMGPNPDAPDAPDAPGARYMNLSTFGAQLQRVVNRIDEIGSVFPQHGAIDLSPALLPEVLAVCKAVLDAPEDYDFVTSFPGLKGEPPVERYNRYIPGLGVMCYRMSGLRP